MPDEADGVSHIASAAHGIGLPAPRSATPPPTRSQSRPRKRLDTMPLALLASAYCAIPNDAAALAGLRSTCRRAAVAFNVAVTREGAAVPLVASWETVAAPPPPQSSDAASDAVPVQASTELVAFRDARLFPVTERGVARPRRRVTVGPNGRRRAASPSSAPRRAASPLAVSGPGGGGGFGPPPTRVLGTLLVDMVAGYAAFAAVVAQRDGVPSASVPVPAHKAILTDCHARRVVLSGASVLSVSSVRMLVGAHKTAELVVTAATRCIASSDARPTPCSLRPPDGLRGPPVAVPGVPALLDAVTLRVPTFLAANVASLTSVDLSGLGGAATRIEDSAFAGCRTLARIDLRGLRNVERIGHAAFQSTGRIQALTVDGDGGLQSLKVLGRKCFESSGIRAIDLASVCENIESIEDRAFAGCRELARAEFIGAQRLATLGFEGFRGTLQLRAVHLTHLPGLRAIGELCFSGSGVESLEISACPALATIGPGAFRGATQLRTATLAGLPLLGAIPNGMFEHCAALQDVMLSDLPALTEIQPNAFDSSGIVAVDLTACTALVKIGARAFARCSALSAVDARGLSHLRTIGADVFVGCAVLSPANLRFDPQSLTAETRRAIRAQLKLSAPCATC